MSLYKQYRVIKRVRESNGVLSLYLQPADGSIVERFTPGQHLMFRVRIPGHDIPFYRYYSFSDSYNESCYRISLKKQLPVEKAQISCSTYLHDVNEGDVLEAKGPVGAFVLEPAENEPVVLIAGGIGITPLLCMLKSIATNNPTRPVYFYYGVNNKEEHAFRDELQQLKKEFPTFQINTFYATTNADDVCGTDYDYEGFVNTGTILQQTGGRQYAHYICGPDVMMQAVKAALIKAGISEQKILTEAFTAPVSDMEETPDDTAPVQNTNGAHLLHFIRSGKKLYWDGRYRSILEFAEANDIEISSGCLFGDCGTCLTKMLQGEVRYNHITMVKPGTGNCLPCSCVPVSEVILNA